MAVDKEGGEQSIVGQDWGVDPMQTQKHLIAKEATVSGFGVGTFCGDSVFD